MRETMTTNVREQFHVETPLRCPVCGGELMDTWVRSLGANLTGIRWEMHSGRCEEHGWFQAETVGKPPRDIFAVDRPFGVSRRLVINGREYYQFPTAWAEVEFHERMNRMSKANRVDPMDEQYWKALPLK
jgi:hypothetical protein